MYIMQIKRVVCQRTYVQTVNDVSTKALAHPEIQVSLSLAEYIDI